MTDQYSTLTGREQSAVVGICILAAFADGALSESERDEIKRVADNFSSPERNLGACYQQALSGTANLGSLASSLQSSNAKSMAYEMAVCICNVDQSLTEAEKKFLAQLRDALQLEPRAAADFQSSAEHMRQEPPILGSVAPGVPSTPNGLDDMIRDRAILAGALELMPQRLATMSIVPVQMQMVYSIGKTYGYDLGVSHAKEFIATVGLGLTSQVLEGYLSKLVGNVTRRFAGKFVGALATQATESAVAFATTYALGQVAKSYYGSGRTLDAGQIRDLFSRMLNEGQNIQSRYVTQISQRAGSLKIPDLLKR